MSPNAVLTVVFLFVLKHFICDFPLQKSYQYLNKGTYGHPGGILHAFIQLIGTFLVLITFFSPQVSLIYAFIDGLIHYHVDWAKMNLNKKMNWKPDNSERFWELLGFDQFVHYSTYLGIIYFLV